MKKTLLAALLAALMLVCTGCASFLERDYSVVQPHSSTYYESEDRSVLRAESYQDLVNDLMLLLTGGAREGTIWLYAGASPAAPPCRPAPPRRRCPPWGRGRRRTCCCGCGNR